MLINEYIIGNYSKYIIVTQAVQGNDPNRICILVTTWLMNMYYIDEYVLQLSLSPPTQTEKCRWSYSQPYKK